MLPYLFVKIVGLLYLLLSINNHGPGIRLSRSPKEPPPVLQSLRPTKYDGDVEEYLAHGLLSSIILDRRWHW